MYDDDLNADKLRFCKHVRRVERRDEENSSRVQRVRKVFYENKIQIPRRHPVSNRSVCSEKVVENYDRDFRQSSRAKSYRCVKNDVLTIQRYRPIAKLRQSKFVAIIVPFSYMSMIQFYTKNNISHYSVSGNQFCSYYQGPYYQKQQWQ